jgi:hypothetical protein
MLAVPNKILGCTTNLDSEPIMYIVSRIRIRTTYYSELWADYYGLTKKSCKIGSRLRPIFIPDLASSSSLSCLDDLPLEVPGTTISCGAETEITA